MDRPRLVLVTPVWPAAGGFGLAMRAGVFLDALAGRHAVTVLVVPVFGAAVEPPAFVRRRSVEAISVDLRPGLDPLFALSAALADPAARDRALAAYPRPALCRFATSATGRCLRDAAPASPFSLVVLRSYLAPYAESLLAPGGGRTLLDLDDDEGLTRRRLAALHRRLGEEREGAREESEAAKYDAHEERWLPRFGTVLTCSETHARRVAERLPAVRTEVLPNTVALPRPLPCERLAGPPRLLFVGNLGYLPNVDGACWLAREILPRVRAAGPGAELRIAGASPTAAVRELARLEGVTLVADPADLAEHYAWARTAVVPLRAGGGTRIKLLEALAAGVPVVSTTLGAEGIAVSHGRDVLLADSPDTLAAACVRLHVEPEGARRQAAAGRALVEARYSHAVAARRLQELFGEPVDRPRYDKLPHA